MMTTATAVMDRAMKRLAAPVEQLLPTDTILRVLEERVDQTGRDVDHAARYLAEHTVDYPFLSEEEEFELAAWLGKLQARHDEARHVLSQARQALGLAA